MDAGYFRWLSDAADEMAMFRGRILVQMYRLGRYSPLNTPALFEPGAEHRYFNDHDEDILFEFDGDLGMALRSIEAQSSLVVHIGSARAFVESASAEACFVVQADSARFSIPENRAVLGRYITRIEAFRTTSFNEQFEGLRLESALRFHLDTGSIVIVRYNFNRPAEPMAVLVKGSVDHNEWTELNDDLDHAETLFVVE